ncbi:hypothetical protein [Streptomyces tubercidicus]|uniref:hypothetical protein n=1 Tax=Streptomyces tubercidicus TaxID=47759 RepID=UPI00346527B1
MGLLTGDEFPAATARGMSRQARPAGLAGVALALWKSGGLKSFNRTPTLISIRNCATAAA